MRRRFTSARALWKTRNSRRSSGWSMIVATVVLMCAGEGKVRGLVASPAGPCGPLGGFPRTSVEAASAPEVSPYIKAG